MVSCLEAAGREGEVGEVGGWVLPPVFPHARRSGEVGGFHSHCGTITRSLYILFSFVDLIDPLRGRALLLHTSALLEGPCSLLHSAWKPFLNRAVIAG